MTQGIPIPITIQGNDALVMLARIVNALEGTGRAAEQSAPKADHLSASLRGVGEAARHINEIREVVVIFAQALYHAAERVGVLAGEQQRLDANSARLGLNFQRAAENAGGFVSEMQTMQLATSLADRGIRATQQELDALSRVGMARAAATGKNLDEVFDSLTDSVIEGGEEMGKFGGNLLRVADGTHSAGERMRAFVDHARNVPQTMRTSADEMARFQNAIQNTQRTLANAFAQEFAQLATLPNTMQSAVRDADEFNDKLRAIGMTAANITAVVGGAIGAALGFMVTGVSTVIGTVRVLAAGLGSLSRGPGAATRAMAQAGEEAFGADSYTAITGRFTTQAAALMMNALRDPYRDRTSAAPATSPTLAGIRDARVGPSRERSRITNPGTPASDVELARIEVGIAIAERESPSERAARHGVEYDTIDGVVLRTKDILRRLQLQRLALLRRQTGEHRQGESGADRRRRVAELRGRIDELTQQLETDDRTRSTAGVREFIQQQAPARERYGEFSRGMQDRARESLSKDRENQTEATERDRDRTPEAAREDMEKARRDRREARALDERRDRYRTFTDEMEQLAGRRINVAREEAEFVTTSFRSMGKAFSDHLTAFVEGKEELGVALQGMLSDTLKAISQEAAVKAGLNLAEGFAALATYRYDAAASHFAAAGIYTGVALASGAVGAAIAPSSSTAAREGAASQERSREAAPMAAGSTTSGGPTVINVAFNGPQFGTGGVVQAARELVGVINQGALQGGVQMNRLAVGAARG